MRQPFWFRFGLILIGLAVAGLALPSRIEGPILLSVSPGHEISTLDTVALIPLLLGSVFIYGGLWVKRETLVSSWRRWPKTGAIALFASGLGLGLLIASAFSAFFWWWAIGATVYAVTVIIAAILAARG